MKKYKGYYIDNFVFHSEAEIDAFLKKKAIDYFIWLNQYFNRNMSIEASAACSEQAQILHDTFGLTWDEIEALEIEATA